MNRMVDVNMKTHKMDLEEDFYSFDFDNEEIPVYKTQEEILSALRQKEEEVILAAQLGNALLLENRQLKEEADKLHEQYTDKLEVRTNVNLTEKYHHHAWSLFPCSATTGLHFSSSHGSVVSHLKLVK